MPPCGLCWSFCCGGDDYCGNTSRQDWIPARFTSWPCPCIGCWAGPGPGVAACRARERVVLRLCWPTNGQGQFLGNLDMGSRGVLGWYQPKDRKGWVPGHLAVGPRVSWDWCQPTLWQGQVPGWLAIGGVGSQDSCQPDSEWAHTQC